MKDVGFGMTVQDKNAPDLVPLYKISNEMGMEFATASLHNSFYFVEAKNIIHDRPMVAKNFENLVNELLRSNSPKKWFRAYFNHGLINYIYGQKRLLPCDMSFDTFFIDPYMLISSKENFDAYCAWLFPVIDKVVALSTDREDQRRYAGALSEFCLDIWVQRNSKKIVELALLETEKPTFFNRLLGYIKRKI